MNETLLYTLPQWFIFSAIIVIVYGWIEDKKPFRIIGALLFMILGIFSLYILTGDNFAPRDTISLTEMANEELGEDEMVQIIPVAELFNAYLSFILTAVLAIPALILDIRNNKKYRLFYILTALASLFGFFVIVGFLKNI